MVDIKKILYWAIGLLILLVIGVFVIAKIFFAPLSNPDQTPNNSSGFPNSNNTTGVPSSPGPGVSTSTTTTVATMRVASRRGDAMDVNDFLHNGETVADIENPGRYMLAGSLGYCIANVGCPSAASTTDFEVTYTASDQAFHIILLTEPLGDARLEAEQFLMSRLGIGQTQMCNLYYYVETLSWVSQIYANKNLGFSFCSGATPL